ncbi:MAG: tyrosine-type recombinase/integrase [Alphaproteobacteria bacterium]|nr:tyrosine-type recombinase/integrase [Alphaproteobacteria bacterium]
MANITKSFVEKLEPQSKNYAMWDGKLAGFGVRVSPKGRKTYILKYRLPDGRQRRRRIGIHGHITCEHARKTALSWHGEIADGSDPTSEISNIKASPTIFELCDRFIKEHSEIHKKPRGIELDKTAIRKHIKPKLGNLKTIAVTKADIQKFHLGMKNMPAHANRILRILSKMFNLAEDWGLRPANSNPVTKVKRYKEEPRERYLSNQEILCLGRALDEAEKNNTESLYFISLIRLLLLTGARLREIMHAKWEWIDWDLSMLKLPDSKTGKKIIHLSPAAFAVLEATPKVKGNPYIIVGNIEGQPLVNTKRAWGHIKEAATVDLLKTDDNYGEIVEKYWKKHREFPPYKILCEEAKKQGLEKPIGLTDVRIHDLRHTYASICVAQGMSLQMVSKLLGHARASTSERYAHLAHDPITNAAAQVGNIISEKL